MSGDKRITFGIAGLGNIAATHASSIQATNGSVLAAACSRSEKNRNAFSEKFSVPLYSTFEELLSHKSLDAVSICTPSGTHLEFGKKAAKAGKHVIVEKPIEISVKRGQELIDCCNQNGVKLAVIYQNRFSENVVRLKKLLNDGELGDQVMMRASVKWFRDQDYYRQSNWRGTLNLDGGGAVINQAIHTLDLVNWMMGGVEEVSAMKGTLTHPGIEAEDNAIALFKFKSGALGVFEASTSIVPAQPRRIEINGTKATAILEDNNLRVLPEKTGRSDQSENSNEAAGASDPLAGMDGGLHKKQYRQIVNAILNDEQPDVSGPDSLRSLALAEAIYQSSERSVFIRLQDLF